MVEAVLLNNMLDSLFSNFDLKEARILEFMLAFKYVEAI